MCAKPPDYADRLDAWWDAYQRGQIGPDVPVNDMDLIQTLSEMYAHAVTVPSETRIWRQTEAPFDGNHDTYELVSSSESFPIAAPEEFQDLAGTGIGASLIGSCSPLITVAPSPMSDQREPIRRPQPWLQLVASLLLICGGGLLLFAIMQGIVSEAGSTQSVPAPASIESPMFLGNPARTGVMPGVGLSSEPAVRWTYATGGAIVGAPAIVNNTLYVGSDDGNVYALDPTNGSELWRFATGLGIQAAPAVANGIVYVGAGHSATRALVVAIDALTGQERWRYELSGSVIAAPLVADGKVYVATTAGVLYGIDAVHGALQWTFTAGDMFYGAPSYANDTVFVGNWDHHLYAVNAVNGSERWRFDAGGSIWASSPVADGLVYLSRPSTTIVNESLSVWALDAISGNVVWNTELPGTATEYQDHDLPIAVADGKLVLQRNQHLFELDALTGRLIWSGLGVQSYDVYSTMTPGNVYFSLGNGFLQSIDLQRAALVWQLQVSNVSLGWPVVWNGIMFVGDANGKLYALGDASHP